MKKKLLSLLTLLAMFGAHYAMAQTPDNVIMTTTGVCNKVVDDLDDIATAVEECATYEYYQYTVAKTTASITREGEAATAPVRDGDVLTYDVTLDLTDGDFPTGGIVIVDTFDITEFDYDAVTYPASITAGTGTIDETNAATGTVTITFTGVDGSDQAVAQVTLIVAVDAGATTPPAEVCNDIATEFTDVYFDDAGSDMEQCENYEYVNYSYTKTLTAIVRDLNGDGTYDPVTETVSAPAKAGDRLYYDIDIPDTDDTPAAGVTLYDVYELYMDHVSNSESVTPDETQDLDSQLIGDEPDANLLEGLLTFPAVQAVDPAIEVVLQLIQ